MKLTLHLSAFLFLLSLVPACSVDDEPLTTAEERYDRAKELFLEQSYAQAEPLFESAVKGFEQQKAEYHLPEAYDYLSQIDLHEGKYRAAFERIQKGIEWSEKMSDVRAQARLILLRGDAHARIGEFTDAGSNYRSAMVLISAFNDEPVMAESELRLASALFESGNIEESFEHYKTAIGLFQKLDNKSSLPLALRGLSKLYGKQERYVEALNSVTQALEVLGQSQDPILEAKLRIDLGLIHRVQGSVNAALSDFRDAATVLRQRKAGRNYEVLPLFYIGSIYFQSGRYEEAKKYYDAALKAAQSQGDRITENYLYIFLIQCNLSMMSPAQRATSTEKLRQSYEQIAKRFQETAHRTGEAFLWMQIGRMYEQAGNIAVAKDMYRRAVDLDESSFGEFVDRDLHEPFQQELGIVRERASWHYSLEGCLVGLGHPDEAVEVIEKARSKRFFSLLEQAEVKRSPLQQPVRDARLGLRKLKVLEYELSGMLASSGRSQKSSVDPLRAEMVQLRQQLGQKITHIVEQDPNYEPLLRLETIKVSEARDLLPGGTLLLEMVPAEKNLILFAITRTQFETRTVAITRDSLLSLMNEYRRLLMNPNVFAAAAGVSGIPEMTRFERLSTKLYDILIRPIDPLMDRNLVIVPVREMEGFPFQALERQDKDNTVRYLIELTTVDYLPSVSSLRYRTASPSDIREVLAVGNPNGKNWSVDYELRDVRSFFKTAKILVGQDASWNNLQSGRGDVLQISTEFTYSKGSSPLGEMMLSSGQMLEESVNVPFERLTELPAYPVVLLSNQYGQGMGLSSEHALLLRINGTSDVFFNAWFADRKASKFFSEFFYTHLSNGLAPGDAYRQALLNMIRTHEISHPHSWGQFFHFGIG